MHEISHAPSRFEKFSPGEKPWTPTYMGGDGKGGQGRVKGFLLLKRGGKKGQERGRRRGK